MDAVTMHNCIVCGKKISVTEHGEVSSGAKLKVTTGFGSAHDGDVYHGYICDKCIVNRNKSGTLVFEENYMFPELSREIHAKYLEEQEDDE